MGIQLDVLVGHPEHDLLFVATQVAAAGLKNPKESVRNARQLRGAGAQLQTLVNKKCTNVPTDPAGRTLKTVTIIFTEAEVYTMLLRGHAPASEPFRKWVTEEVLPTIRKTGKYDAEQSTSPAVGSSAPDRTGRDG